LDDKQPSVLIVDDEQGILDSLEDLLEDEFKVITSTDPCEGLKILQSHEVGVVLSDQRMPKMQGHEFLSEVSRYSKATRMLITGYTDMDALVNAVNRSQIFAFVAKPWDPGHLRSLVQTAMEHFKLARELLYEKHLMESLMATVPDPIFFIGRDGGLLRVNRAAQRLLGVEACPAGGCRASTFLRQNPSLQPLIGGETIGQRTVDSVQTIQGETRWHSTVRVPFGGGEGIISVSHDITERHQAELELARQAFALEYSYRELHQFAHVTAHHLQEPLRDVVSHLQILGNRLDLGVQERESLDFAVTGASRMKMLFSDFIRYIDFNAENCPLEEVDLEELWGQVVRSRKNSLEKLQCAPRISGSLPTIVGRATYLNYLFEELLENSIKFSDGGPLEFRVNYQETSKELRLVVSDNGPGVEEEELELIFELFQRLHPVGCYEGTGLGLALCRKIMRLHEGEIWAQLNHPDPGLSLVLVFPRKVIV